MAKKKSLWDNSSLQQDIPWDNQMLPGITDEELFATNWNLKKSDKDKERAKSKSLALLVDAEYQRKQQQGQNKRKESGWNKKMLGNTNGAGGKSRTGLKNSAESNERRSKSLIGIERHNLRGVPKPKLTCPHCGKEGGRPQMIQYHFEKCKHKAQ